MASGFVLVKVVAVYTGPGGVAMLGQVQSLFGVLNGIVAAPVGAGVTRYTAENQADGFYACAPWWKASLSWVVKLLIIVTTTSCLFASPIALWVFGDSKYYWLVVTIALALPFSVANSLTGSVINGLHQYRRFVVLGIISAIVATVVMVLLVFKAKLEGAMIAAALFMSISGLVMLIGSFRQPWFRLKYWWGKSDIVNIRGIGGYILMAMTSALTASLSLILIRNILIDNVGLQQTGIWQAVWRISEVYLGVITVALSTYFLPKLASLKGIAKTLIEIQNTTKVVMPTVILLAVIIYLCRDLAISLLFTEEFSPARDIFATQLIGDVFKILSWMYAYPMLSRGKTSWYIFTDITFSIIFVLLAYFMVPLYQTQVASIAYTFTYFICFIFLYKNVKRFST
jgi:PST family polysaccharide transporter